MHPCYLSKLERKGRLCLYEKDAHLKLWPMMRGGGGGEKALIRGRMPF